MEMKTDKPPITAEWWSELEAQMTCYPWRINIPKEKENKKQKHEASWHQSVQTQLRDLVWATHRAAQSERGV